MVFWKPREGTPPSGAALTAGCSTPSRADLRGGMRSRSTHSACCFRRVTLVDTANRHLLTDRGPLKGDWCCPNSRLFNDHAQSHQRMKPLVMRASTKAHRSKRGTTPTTATWNCTTDKLYCGLTDVQLTGSGGNTRRKRKAPTTSTHRLRIRTRRQRRQRRRLTDRHTTRMLSAARRRDFGCDYLRAQL